MDKAKGIARKGWHAEKDGKSLSSVLGRGKDSSPSYTSSEVAAASSRPTQPLSSLRDPSTFAPPPRSVHHPNYDPVVDGPSASATAARSGPPVPRRDTAPTSTSPASTARRPSEAEDEPPKPTGPFRANTTGLNTTGLPPPPTRIVQRSDTAPVPAPAPASTNSASEWTVTKPPPPALPSRAAGAGSETSPPPPYTARPKPTLPPRLPPREPQAPSAASPPAPSQPAHVLNQGVVEPSRGGVAQDFKPSLSGNVPGRDANVSELQARFAKIRATEREHEEEMGAKAPTPVSGTRRGEEAAAAPPPVPLGTKPR